MSVPITGNAARRRFWGDPSFHERVNAVVDVIVGEAKYYGAARKNLLKWDDAVTSVAIALYLEDEHAGVRWYDGKWQRPCTCEPHDRRGDGYADEDCPVHGRHNDDD